MVWSKERLLDKLLCYIDLLKTELGKRFQMAKFSSDMSEQIDFCALASAQAQP